MDAAVYEWFNNEVTFLHLAVDRGTKKVLYGLFDYQETAKAYYIILMNIIINYGIPNCIRTDKRGCFNVNNSKHQKTKVDLTQFGKICEELEINLTCSSNPVFKPNVEIENKTFKGRLKAELRKNNIKTIEEANKYLNEIFIPKMNESFSYVINPRKNQMQENIYTNEELNIIIFEKYTRQIDNASSFKYNNHYYIPINIDTGEAESFNNKTEVITIIAYDKSIWCKVNDNLYQTKKLEKRKQEDKEVTKTKTQEEINRSKAHKPSPNHSWRKNMMLK